MRINFKFIIKIIFHILLVIYLVYHIFSGEYGIYSYLNINTTLIHKKNKLSEVQDSVDKQQDKINRLKTNNLDLDLFEEELKKNTGLISKDEIIIFTNDLEKVK